MAAVRRLATAYHLAHDFILADLRDVSSSKPFNSPEKRAGVVSHSPKSLNINDLGELLRNQRKRKGVGLRTAAHEIGVAFSTLARVERGHIPDIETFSRLARWLGRSPAEFFGQETASSESTPDVIEAHLRGDPALSSRAAEQIAGIVRESYDTLARPAGVAVAYHLRAASTMKPEASAIFTELLTEMHDALLAEEE